MNEFNLCILDFLRNVTGIFKQIIYNIIWKGCVVIFMVHDCDNGLLIKNYMLNMFLVCV